MMSCTYVTRGLLLFSLSWITLHFFLYQSRWSGWLWSMCSVLSCRELPGPTANTRSSTSSAGHLEVRHPTANTRHSTSSAGYTWRWWANGENLTLYIKRRALGGEGHYREHSPLYSKCRAFDGEESYSEYSPHYIKCRAFGGDGHYRERTPLDIKCRAFGDEGHYSEDSLRIFFHLYNSANEQTKRNDMQSHVIGIVQISVVYSLINFIVCWNWNVFCRKYFKNNWTRIFFITNRNSDILFGS